MPVCERLRAIRPSSFAPCARYLCAFPDKGGSQDGAFSCLDAAHGQVLVEIEIDRANLGLRIAGYLLLDSGGSSERLFDRGMATSVQISCEMRCDLTVHDTFSQ